jgi:hypothetical protein
MGDDVREIWGEKLFLGEQIASGEGFYGGGRQNHSRRVP